MNIQIISRRRLSKLREKILSKNVGIPKSVLDWQYSLTGDELNSCIAHGMIPIDQIPADMINPWDCVKERLPDDALEWSRKNIALARLVKEEDCTKDPTWVQLVLIIYEFLERKEAGIADSLPAGSDPLTWNDFVQGEPFKRAGEEREYYAPAKNYRKKPKNS